MEKIIGCLIVYLVVKDGINQLKMIPITARAKPGVLSRIPPMIKVIDLNIKIKKMPGKYFYLYCFLLGSS